MPLDVNALHDVILVEFKVLVDNLSLWDDVDLCYTSIVIIRVPVRVDE